MADAGAQQQDLGRPLAQFQDPTLGQPRGGRPAPRRHEPHAQRDCAGAYYRRVAYRLGRPKAITASARKLALLVYRVLRGDIVYRDPGATAYLQHHHARLINSLRRRAQELGLGLISLETGEVFDHAAVATVS